MKPEVWEVFEAGIDRALANAGTPPDIAAKVQSRVKPIAKAYLERRLDMMEAAGELLTGDVHRRELRILQCLIGALIEVEMPPIPMGGGKH